MSNPLEVEVDGYDVTIKGRVEDIRALISDIAKRLQVPSSSLLEQYDASRVQPQLLQFARHFQASVGPGYAEFTTDTNPGTWGPIYRELVLDPAITHMNARLNGNNSTASR